MRKLVHEILRENGLWPKDVKSVLDLGCGHTLKSKYAGFEHIVGVDLHRPYLECLLSVKNCLPICHDVRKIKDIIIDKSFDVVYLCDILEHISRKAGNELLENSAAIAKVAIVVEVGKEYIPQDIDITGFGAHTLQTHRSAWNEKCLNGFTCVTLPYKMSDVKRHTQVDVDPNIEQIYGIKYI